MKLAALSAAMIVAGAASAQTTNAVSANVVQNVNFKLTFYEQAGLNQQRGNTLVDTVVKRKFTTQELIQALGNATDNNFSRSAKLVAVFGSNSSTVEVRDKSNVVDVSSYFVGLYNTGTNILSNVKTVQSGKESGQEFWLAHLMVTNDADALSLDLRGFGITKISTVNYKGASYMVGQLSENLSGSGVYNGTNALVTGTVTITGHKFEQE
ncbi:MAG: hypothetical protein ACREFE_07820 [Limisphaerales bacterium]